MKKKYEKPVAEKITFDYTIMAATGSGCWSETTYLIHDTDCTQKSEWHNNTSV